MCLNPESVEIMLMNLSMVEVHAVEVIVMVYSWTFIYICKNKDFSFEVWIKAHIIEDNTSVSASCFWLSWIYGSRSIFVTCKVNMTCV